MNEKTYTSEDLNRIGQNVASLWGGSCISVEYDKKEKVYVFDCIEHGERFITTLKSSELKEYDY